MECVYDVYVQHVQTHMHTHNTHMHVHTDGQTGINRPAIQQQTTIHTHVVKEKSFCVTFTQSVFVVSHRIQQLTVTLKSRLPIQILMNRFKSHLQNQKINYYLLILTKVLYLHAIIILTVIIKYLGICINSHCNTTIVLYCRTLYGGTGIVWMP